MLQNRRTRMLRVLSIPFGVLLAVAAGAWAQEPPVPPPTGIAEAGPPSGGVTEGLVLHLAPDPAGAAELVDGGPNRIRSVPHGGLRRTELAGRPAVEFDGQTGWIELEPSPWLDRRGDLTVEVLAVLPADVAAGGFFMMVWRGDERGGCDPYSFGLTGGQLVFRRDLPKIIQVAWPVKSLDFSRPHVFAGVHRSYEEILELWVDGKKVGHGKIAGNFKYDSAGMLTQIGAMDSGRSQFFRGAIGQVKIFRRPLTPEELVADAASLLGP